MNKPVAWEGAEEWEHLAWELCADEHGEESCHDLIWDMGVIPEPWGERWLKYEDEAKRMIAMVRKCTNPAELTDEEWKLLEKVINDCADTIEYRIDTERLAFKGYEHCSELESLYEEQKDASRAKAILRKAQEK